MEFIVICCGGGGIPVIHRGRKFSGIEAVIDKDLTSAVLAQEIHQDIFVIVTDVAGVGVNYGTPNQKMLRKIHQDNLYDYLIHGYFPSGFMKPKVEAIIQFYRKTGKRGIICHLKDIERDIKGTKGTEIIQ